jgi:hypothetical protein
MEAKSALENGSACRPGQPRLRGEAVLFEISAGYMIKKFALGESIFR